MSRRAFVLAGAAAAAGCAELPFARERIVETATQRALTRDALLAALRGQELVLLGEVHDNPRHHVLRGALIADLGASVAVLAEQLPRGRHVAFGADLRTSLVDAGFDAKGWQWPLHEPLFAAVARSGATLAGSNLPIELVRRIAREGHAALPPELAAEIDAAPLGGPARAALDQDLVEGHCGRLAGPRLDAMRWAQRARDASFLLAIDAARAAQRAAGRDGPVVLVAGNGHVRSDYGVGQLLAQLRPALRWRSVAFVESGASVDAADGFFAWITAAAERDDPCAGFTAASAGVAGA